MKKYVIHYPLLVERKEYIDSLIAKGTLGNVEYISTWNREFISQNQEPKYKPDENKWIKKCKNYYAEIPPFRELKPGDIACTLNHVEAWKKVAEHGDALILEDDAIFCKNFNSIFDQIVSTSPDFDVLFVGGAFYHESVAKTKSKFNDYHCKSHPSTNTICAYVLTKKSAKLLVKNFTEHTLPTDFEMNYWFDELNFNVYHHIPYLIKEGTSAGYYKTCQQR